MTELAKDGPTARDICVAWVKRIVRPGTADEEIETLAEAYFNSGAGGELDHVFVAGYILGMLEPPDEIKDYIDAARKDAAAFQQSPA